jgi:TolB-like protein/DNA-binding winged helix-turn-helix (wHTH) protein/Flp pilus assembly protein TadD
MPAPTASAPGLIRFSVFEADLQTGELRKNGAKVKLEGQPFRVLAILLERPGQLVTREELQQKLWSADTFVDFEHGINTAVKRLREALGDSADSPRYIETLPRRGYRFIYPINGTAAAPALPAPWWRQIRVMAPSVSVLALAALLVASNVGGLRDRMLGRPTPGEITSIAVLPLRNISGDPEQDYFSAGMTEMLITELGRIPGLRVLSHQSVLQYAGSKKPLSEIARELNVHAVIEGTTHRHADRARITINFVQAAPERHLISEAYEPALRDILSVQGQVARDVAAKIHARLTPQQEAYFARSQPADAQAAEAFLKGVRHQRQGTDEHRGKARDYYLKVIEIDPGFAPAYARLAILHSHGGLARAGGERPARGEARRWATEALKLDDKLADAYTALGWADLTDQNWLGAEQNFKRAIELNPSFATAHTWYAQFLANMRRFDEAFVQGERAIALDPASPDTLLHATIPYWEAGRVDEALAHWQKAVDLDPNYSGTYHFLCRAYIKKGMHAEAIAAIQKAIALEGPSPINLALLAYAHAQSGHRDEALRIIRPYEERFRRDGGGLRHLAYAYTGLREKDKAYAVVKAAVDRGAGWLFELNSEPLFEPLRADPRILQLMAQINLPVETPPTQTANPQPGSKSPQK